MLTADSVYDIAMALSKEELRKLYTKIGKDLNKDEKPNGLSKKPNRISDKEISDMVMTRIFKVEIGK